MSITTRAAVRWAAARKIEVSGPKGGTAIFDGDATQGPSPVEALLGAIASCSAIDIVEVLAKKKTPVSSLDVAVVGVRVDTHPRRLTAVTLTFTISGEGIDQEAADRAAELSVTKYCSVRASLDPAIQVDWTVVLKG